MGGGAEEGRGCPGVFCHRNSLGGSRYDKDNGQRARMRNTTRGLRSAQLGALKRRWLDGKQEWGWGVGGGFENGLTGKEGRGKAVQQDGPLSVRAYRCN